MVRFIVALNWTMKFSINFENGCFCDTCLSHGKRKVLDLGVLLNPFPFILVLSTVITYHNVSTVLYLVFPKLYIHIRNESVIIAVSERTKCCLPDAGACPAECCCGTPSVHLHVPTFVNGLQLLGVESVC